MVVLGCEQDYIQIQNSLVTLMSSNTENKTLGFITDVTSGKFTSVFCLAEGEGWGELCIH